MHTVTSADVPLRDFLDAAARKQPTPGGGSVAALVGALAAAMGEMTLNYSTGRKANSPEAQSLLQENLAELHRARALLLELMVEDQRAYADLTAAKKLNESDPDRAGKMELATLAAIRIPEAIMAAGMSVLQCAARTAEHANRWLLSDLAVCGELAMATIRCGAYNVRANLGEVRQEDRARLEADCQTMTGRAVESLNGLMRTIEERTRAR